MVVTIEVQVQQQGLHDITATVQNEVSRGGLVEGLCTLFIQHTSASLLIQENYDPTAKRDLENWLNRLVPENDSLYTHLTEGSDDMPAHLKASVLGSAVSIPITNGSLNLGTWQGVYLCEHRDVAPPRSIVITVQGDAVGTA